MKKVKKFPNIGRLVYSARVEANLTQAELSERIGYMPNGQFVSNVERGLSSIPSTKYKILCNVLNIFPQELEKALLLDAEFHIKRALYPEQIKRLNEEYGAWINKESTNSYNSKMN